MKSRVQLSVLLQYAQGIQELDAAAKEVDLSLVLRARELVWPGHCLVSKIVAPGTAGAREAESRLTTLTLTEKAA